MSIAMFRATAGLPLWWALVLTLAAPAARADDADEALRRLEEGVSLYNVGDYRAAHVQFVAAQTLAPERANPYRWLGLSEAKLGDCAQAIGHLERFVALSRSNDPRVAEVLRERDRCKREVAASGSRERAIRPAPIAGLRRRVAGLSLAGVGAALLVTGVTCAVLTSLAADDYNQSRTYAPGMEDTYWTYLGMTIGFSTLGVAAAVTGTVLAAQGYREGRTVAFAPFGAPGGAGVTLGGSF